MKTLEGILGYNLVLTLPQLRRSYNINSKVVSQCILIFQLVPEVPYQLVHHDNLLRLFIFTQNVIEIVVQPSKYLVRGPLVYDLEPSIAHVREVAFEIVDVDVDLLLDLHDRSPKITFRNAVFLRKLFECFSVDFRSELAVAFIVRIDFSAIQRAAQL